MSKHNAARAMLDILEGRASAVTEEVSQSITDGLKALRGDQEKSPSPGPKTFKPQFICKQSEQEYLDSQKKHQEEIIKQSLEYGPLGVKLWFSGDSKIKEITSETSTASPSSQLQPNRAPSEPFNTDDDRFGNVNKGQFFIKGLVYIIYFFKWPDIRQNFPQCPYSAKNLFLPPLSFTRKSYNIHQ